MLTELRAKEKERAERHRLLDSRKKWREEEERAQQEKNQKENERICGVDRTKNVRPTDISDRRQFDKPQKHQRRNWRDLEARQANDAPYSALEAGGGNDTPYSHSSARGGADKTDSARGKSPNGENSVLSQLQKAYGSSQEGPVRRKRPGASGTTPRQKDGISRTRDPSPRPRGSTPRVEVSESGHLREGTPRLRASPSPGRSKVRHRASASSGKRHSDGGGGNMRRLKSSGILREAGKRHFLQRPASSAEDSPQYTRF